jgi:hypothetical protein
MTWTARDDAAIRAWLHDAAPDRAPASVLDATFARTRALPAVRTRARWREPRVALLLAAALALAVILGGAVVIALSRPPESVPVTTLAQPRFLGDFLWSGGYELEVDVAPTGAVPGEAVRATAAGELMAPYLGPPDAPIFGRLRCIAPALCGPHTLADLPADVGTADVWSVWIVEYPQEEAFRILSAWDGRMITGWDGDDLQSCSEDEIGTEPLCTADTFEEPRELPADVRTALAVWGQAFPYAEWQYTTTRPDNGPYWPPDGIDPMAVARTLVDEPRVVDAFQGELACQRAACPDGVVTESGQRRLVAIVVVDDGARWVIVDPTTGQVLASDETPVKP